MAFRPHKRCRDGKHCYWIHRDGGCRYLHTAEEINYQQRKLEESKCIGVFVEKQTETKEEKEERVKKEHDAKLKEIAEKDELVYTTDRGFVYGLVLLLEVHEGKLPQELSIFIWSFVTTYEGISLPKLGVIDLWKTTKKELECSCCKLTTSQWDEKKVDRFDLSTAGYDREEPAHHCYVCKGDITTPRAPLTFLIHRKTKICYRIHKSGECFFRAGLTTCNVKKCKCKEESKRCESCLFAQKYKLEYVLTNYFMAKMCPMTDLFTMVTPSLVKKIVVCESEEEKKRTYEKSDEIPEKKGSSEWYHIRDRKRFNAVQQHLKMIVTSEVKICMFCPYSHLDFYCDGMRLCNSVSCHWKAGITVRKLGFKDMPESSFTDHTDDDYEQHEDDEDD
jgi:hypothetical protein